MENFVESEENNESDEIDTEQDEAMIQQNFINRLQANIMKHHYNFESRTENGFLTWFVKNTHRQIQVALLHKVYIPTRLAKFIFKDDLIYLHLYNIGADHSLEEEGDDRFDYSYNQEYSDMDIMLMTVTVEGYLLGIPRGNVELFQNLQKCKEAFGGIRRHICMDPMRLRHCINYCEALIDDNSLYV